MVNNSQGGYRIIDLQEENIFEKMAEIITEPKPLLIAGNTENGTTDFITASHEIQINRDGNGNVISYRVPTGAVNHSDIDGRGEEDWWQYFTYVTPSGNTFTREKISEVFNREAQTIHVLFPSELTKSVTATSNFVNLWIDTDENQYFIGQFSILGSQETIERIITNFETSTFIGDYRVTAKVSYNEDTLMYDVNITVLAIEYHQCIEFPYNNEDFSKLIENRRLSDKPKYVKDDYIELKYSCGKHIVKPNCRYSTPTNYVLVNHELCSGVPFNITYDGHVYRCSITFDNTEKCYRWTFFVCVDAEPLYADTELYGDVKINDHNIDVADGVISVKSASTENRGVVQIDDTNITITDESIIGVPTATKEVRGVVQVGEHIGVTDGVITPDIATKEQLGIVQVGDNIDVTDGVVSVPVATVNTKGVVSTGPTISNVNGSISVTVESLLKEMQFLDSPLNITLGSLSQGEPDDTDYTTLMAVGSLDSSAEGFVGFSRYWRSSIDEETFIGSQWSQSPDVTQSAYFTESVLKPFRNYFLIHKVTIEENTYYVRIPIKFRLSTLISFNPTQPTAPLYMVNGYIDFRRDSFGTWETTNFIPDLEVGATGTKIMTYDASTSQVTPMMKAFSVNITMPDGNTYSFPSHELYVQDGKAYIVTADINLNQENPAVTDTFATYTFTRVF